MRFFMLTQSYMYIRINWKNNQHKWYITWCSWANSSCNNSIRYSIWHKKRQNCCVCVYAHQIFYLHKNKMTEHFLLNLITCPLCNALTQGCFCAFVIRNCRWIFDFSHIIFVYFILMQNHSVKTRSFIYSMQSITSSVIVIHMVNACFWQQFKPQCYFLLNLNELSQNGSRWTWISQSIHFRKNIAFE